MSSTQFPPDFGPPVTHPTRPKTLDELGVETQVHIDAARRFAREAARTHDEFQNSLTQAEKAIIQANLAVYKQLQAVTSLLEQLLLQR